MEREIKFRVWDSTPIADGFKGIMVNHDYAIKSDYLIDAFNGVYPIMQFTGLKDKNGVEIYEGDILSEKWKTEVYKDVEGTYMVRFHTNPKLNKPKSLYQYLKGREKAGTSEIDCVIIGNIHENIELLK